MDLFHDNLDVIGDDPITVTARLSMLPTDQGGRGTPLTGGYSYRPNHNFGDEDNRFFYIGSVEIPKGDLVYPGEIRELRVLFLNVQGLLELLEVGRKWRIQEGSNLAGIAEVLSVET